jgi:SOS response regulatory protein OraA/RecX
VEAQLAQLALFGFDDAVAAAALIARRRIPKSNGPARLLHDLVEGGVPEDAWTAAAALVLVLDDGAGAKR